MQGINITYNNYSVKYYLKNRNIDLLFFHFFFSDNLPHACKNGILYILCFKYALN